MGHEHGPLNGFTAPYGCSRFQDCVDTKPQTQHTVLGGGGGEIAIQDLEGL